MLLVIGPVIVPTASIRLTMIGAEGATLLITRLSGSEWTLDVPAWFVSVTVMGCVPLDRSVVGVNDHVPSGLTVVVPIGVAPSYTVMVWPAVPLPLMIGCASAVVVPEGIAWPLSSVMTGTAGLAGTVVSTTTLMGAEGVLGVPAGLVSITTMAFGPSGRAGEGVNDQLPLSGIVSEPIGVPLSITVMVSPGVPLPLMSGVASFVGVPEMIGRPVVSLVTTGTGVAGVVVSTLKLISVECALVPAELVCVASMSCAPLASAAAGLTLHVPSVPTVVEPISVEPSYTLMTLPAVPVPVSV